MPRFRGRVLGHAALLVVAALVATACGTTQTAQAPSPSPSPSPGPGGTAIISGKVLIGDLDALLFCIELFLPSPPAVQRGGARPAAQGPTCWGQPRDGIRVSAWDDAAIPARAGLRALYEKVLSNPKVQRNAQVRARLQQKLSRISKTKPAKVPGSATPIATTTTSNGNYTLQVPASFVGKDVLVCVEGRPVTPTATGYVGVCTTMTVQPNQPGNTAINNVNFFTIEESAGLVAEIRSSAGSAWPGGVPIPQLSPVDVVFMDTVSSTLRDCLRTSDPGGLGIFYAAPNLWPFYSGYGTQSTALTSPIRITDTLPAPNVWQFQGVVQWRSDPVVDTLYLLDLSGCAAGIVTTETFITTVTANAGQFVAPLVEESAVFEVLVARDTVQPNFNVGGLGTPATADGNYKVDADPGPGVVSEVQVPFSEPLHDSSGSTGEHLVYLSSFGVTCPGAPGALGIAGCSEWSGFVPATDTVNWSRPNAQVAVYDAHQGTWVTVTGPNVAVHRQDQVDPLLLPLEQPDTLTAVRLRAWADDLRAPNNQGEVLPSRTWMTRYSGGATDAWITAADPLQILDLAGNVTGPGALLSKGGVVVP